MKYKLVIFDFDGTLADSFPWFLQAVNKAAQEFHFRPLDTNQLDTLRSFGARQLISHLGLPFWKLPSVGRYMRRLMAESADDIKLFEGVERMLAGLEARGVGSALLTSNSAENVRHVLTEKNFSYFKYVESGVSLFSKRARFRSLLKASNLKASDVLYVGDEIRDAEAAKAEGITFIGVVWGYTNAEALQQVSEQPLLQTPDELLDLL